ncbi:phosphoinositide phospholipase C [Ranunculus cassubicifolius]
MSSSKHNIYPICFGFRRKFQTTIAEAPPSIKTLFKTYSENGFMTADHLQRFLIEVQGEMDTTKESAQAVLDRIEHRKMDIDAFFKYISGDLNPPLSPTPQVHQDMTAPLSEYFIYTGHNSYLTGNQITSDCSVTPIVESLEKGVRGIELDLWPGSTKDGVEVLHGRTLTTPVGLQECLNSIKENAFSASDYPLVITLEDHLDPNRQKKAAKMLIDTFGKLLFLPGPKCLKELPSPESLKKKILISTKPPKEYIKEQVDDIKTEGLQKIKKSSEEKSWGREVSDSEDDSGTDDKDDDDIEEDHHGRVTKIVFRGLKLLKKLPSSDSFMKRIASTNRSRKGSKETNSYKVTENGTSYTKQPSEEKSSETEDPVLKHGFGSNDKNEHDLTEDYQVEEDPDVEGNTMQQTEEPQYKHLIAIHAGRPKGGIMEALRIDPHKARRISMSEKKLKKTKKDHGPDIIRFTHSNLLRVYPKGTRVNSSNFNPLVGWSHGAQMVAFNMQGYGRSLWLMQGMFRANGSCGYVKKPNILMKVGPNNEVFDPRCTLQPKKILKVHLYMGDGWSSDFRPGYFDRFSPPDFYTKIGIAGVPADSKMKRTEVIKDNWTPIWNGEFEFELSVPELALLRIEVHEHDDMPEKDDFAGQTCLPVWELRTGIRAVPLFNRKGVQYPSVKLLMGFDFIEYTNKDSSIPSL